MKPRRVNGMNIMSYSEMVCSAVRLGVSLDELLVETRIYHGRDFRNRVEKVVKTILNFD